MPLYDCKCVRGHIFERRIPLTEFAEEIICDCGATAKRCIAKPMIFGGRLDYEYACPITGEHISSKRQHEENLKKHGCRVLETGEREYNSRVQARANEEFERKIDQTIERAIDTMPSEKREQLGKELEAGVSVSVDRR